MKHLKDLPELIADARLLLAEMHSIISFRTDGIDNIDSWEVRSMINYADSNLVNLYPRIKQMIQLIEDKKAAQPEGERL